jgi:hypothetical protein
MTAANTMSILKGANWRDARWTLGLRKWGGHAVAVIVRFKALAPYALIELVLPGGSVMALLLWLYRRRKNGVGFGRLPVKLLAFLRLADPLRSNAAVCAAPSDLLVDFRSQLRLCDNGPSGSEGTMKKPDGIGLRPRRYRARE